MKRLFILTDITSLIPSVREPDDGQSMIRLMLYSCDIQIEGLAASSNLGHGQVCRPGLIEQVVEAYGLVHDSLTHHNPNYPTAADLQSVIREGYPVALPGIPPENSIGPGKDTSASQALIQALRKTSPEPLWVAVWGGTADLAQALWRLREACTEAELAELLSHLRVHAVGDQDSTGPWIRANFPNLYYITRFYGVRGMYRGGDTSLVWSDWVERNILRDHGPLGALYPNYDAGDIFIRELGPVKGIKEGDTPSYLGMVPNGLNPNMVPEWGGWGGRWAASPDNPFHFYDAVDYTKTTPGDLLPQMSATYRWRPAFQADFAARMDWCVHPFKSANHAPAVNILPEAGDEEFQGALLRRAAPLEWTEIDASPSTDPDGNSLTFHCEYYPEPGGLNLPIEIDSSGSVFRVRIPAVTRPRQIHLIISAVDDGSPSLCGYRRVILSTTD